MPYLFHEPAPSVLPARSTGIRPGIALAVAILGTALTMVLVSAIVG